MQNDSITKFRSGSFGDKVKVAMKEAFLETSLQKYSI